MWWKFVKVLETCWFPKILIQNVLAIFSKNLLFFFFVENFEPETCWKSCWIFSRKFWYSYQNSYFSRWSCLVFWKIDKNLVGFSYEDLGKFSKSLSFFLKIFDLKLVEEFSFENFDILTKICGAFLKWSCLLENFVGLCQKRTMTFSKILLDFLRTFIVTFKKTLSTLEPEMQETP